MKSRNSNLLFQEVQRFRQPLIWLFITCISLLTIYGLVQQLILGKPFGSNPAPDIVLVIIVAVVGFGLPVFFYITNLTTEVRSDGLYIRFFPLHISFRKINLEAISFFEVQTYSPIKDYGGWGIRYGRNGKAYNVGGNRGVQLRLSDGTQLLIGSQKAQEFAEALSKAMSKK